MENKDIRNIRSKTSKIRKRLLTSILCGLAVAMVCILRPSISYYLLNEGEFWFSLESVIGNVLMIFAITAFILALIHFILPARGRIKPRLLFAGLAVLITTVWLITDSFLYPFVFGHYYIDGVLSYLMCMMIPMPLWIRIRYHASFRVSASILLKQDRISGVNANTRIFQRMCAEYAHFIILTT